MKLRVKKMVQRHKKLISTHKNKKKLKIKKRTHSQETVLPMTSIDIAKLLIEKRQKRLGSYEPKVKKQVPSVEFTDVTRDMT